MSYKELFAKIIRIVSVPPVMVSTLVIILCIYGNNIFSGWLDVSMALLLLGIVPVLAYPICSIKPTHKSDKSAKRDGQRKLAFIFSIIGYTLALILSVIFKVSISLLLICATYFSSVIILSLVNKVFKIKASGHACSVTGPIIFLIYFIVWRTSFLGLLFAGLVAWSSLYLKRHTKMELFM